jgi:hypothetical protein
MSLTYDQCCELANDGAEGYLVDYCGYEVPYNIHRLTKKVLSRLKRDGIVVVNYDDQYGRISMEELEDIAGAIGLTFAHVRNHQFIIADEDGGLVKAMSLDSIDSDFPE